MLLFFRRVGKKLPDWIVLFTGCIFACILGVLVVGGGAFSFAYHNGVPVSNEPLMLTALLAIAAGMAGYWLKKRAGGGCRPSPAYTALQKEPCNRFLLWLCLGNILLFMVQLVYVRSLWFYAGWDVSHCYEAALELAQGQALTHTAYFQLCPNNAPLTLALSVPMWIGIRLGLAVPYLLLPVFGAALINLAALCTVLCAYRLTKSRWATCFCYALCTVFILLSPYLSIPYTDAYSILFPVLALYVYLSRIRGPIKWFLVGLFSSVGAALKVTVLIFLIALALVKGLRTLAALPWSRKAIKRIMAFTLACLLGLGPGIAFQSAACLMLAGSVTPEGQLGFTHYLMLGVNPQTFGGHSPEDVAFSLSFPTLKERSRANMREFFSRLTAMSLVEGARFFAVKLYKAYNSGTFEWNGSHLPIEIPKREDPVSIFLRSIYYSRGQYNRLFVIVYQGLWLMILLLCACGLFLTRKEQPHLPLLGLTHLGVAFYLLLFEVWPRYLFLYAPFFAILATLGARSLCAGVRRLSPSLRASVRLR